MVTNTLYVIHRGYTGRDMNSASTLLTCLITSAKEGAPGQLHPILPEVLKLVLTKLQSVKSKSVKVRMLEVLLAAIHYDAVATLSALEQIAPGSSSTVFGLVFSHLKDMERDFSMRLIVLAFTALLSLPGASLPDIVRANVASMFQQVVRELVLIEEEARKPEDEEDEEGDGDDEDDDEEDEDMDDADDDFDDSDAVAAAARRAKALYVPDGGYDEDEDCVNAEDEEYRAALEEMDKEDRVKKELYRAGGGDDDDEALDDEDEDEDYTYTSPIENLNMSQMFLTAMTALGQRDPAFVESLRGGLLPEDQARLEQIVHFANNPIVLNNQS